MSSISLVSSANKDIDECDTVVARSFMYTRKSKGPNTLPWGTPESTGRSEEWVLFICTNWHLPSR